MISINVKDSEAVEYPTAGSDGYTLKFFTNFTFLVNHTYYVLMDPGEWNACTLKLQASSKAEVGGAG